MGWKPGAAWAVRLGKDESQMGWDQMEENGKCERMHWNRMEWEGWIAMGGQEEEGTWAVK